MMVERFLRYSLRWDCPIKLVYMDGGKMKTGNVTVLRYSGQEVDIITARARKTPRTLQLSEVLAAGYARGDDGDTAKKTRLPGKEEDGEQA